MFIETRSTRLLVPGSDSSKLLAAARLESVCGSLNRGTRPVASFSVWFFSFALCRTTVLALLLGVPELAVRCFELEGSVPTVPARVEL